MRFLVDPAGWLVLRIVCRSAVCILIGLGIDLMQALHSHYTTAKRAYDAGGTPHDELCRVTEHALGLLQAGAQPRTLATCDGKPYSVFEAAGRMSRPFRPTLLEANPAQFRSDWGALVTSAAPADHRYDCGVDLTNRALYSALTAFSVCYDLWKPGSRKTPGTFFEVVLGSLLQPLLPAHRREGHVILPGQSENVSTDIVFHKPGNAPGGLVIPAKITTRERIVQPFAHQRILDSVFGTGAFKSVLVCVSEMQRDKEANANAICVPGTIRLFQMHLAEMAGICYLDPPARYLATDVSGIIPVATVGDLLDSQLPGLL